LPFITPELRETGKEVGLALTGARPELLTDQDIRGTLHAHTTESDGEDSLEDMVQTTKDRGYAYLGLTDHSQTAHYAGGLKPAEVRAQQQHIDTLNNKFGSQFRIFKGIESDNMEITVPNRLTRLFLVNYGGNDEGCTLITLTDTLLRLEHLSP
jgi:DNA polymerase (family 10)